MVDKPDIDAGTGRRAADPEASDGFPVSRDTWRSRLRGHVRLRETITERDQARSERDAMRRALTSARSERDTAREALAEARTECRVVREELERTRSDLEKARAEGNVRLQHHLDQLTTETRAIQASQKSTDRRVRTLHRELITDIQALDQLMSRYSPQAKLPPVAGWALSPAGLLALTDAIESRGAHTVVECGSGTSTLWMGFALRKLGRGKLIALEHHPEYAEGTRSVVAAHDLNDFVEVRDAPLVPHLMPRGEFSWYSVDLDEFKDQIDVLLVDGPPGTTGLHARYPALSVFGDRLAPGSLVVADDTDRRDEKEMLEFWLEEEPRLHRVMSPGPGIEMLEFA